MKVIGVIPARAKSKRFPNKPLADIWGRPMVARVYDRAARADALDEVYIATDDANIAEVCDKAGIRFVMTSSEHRTGTDRLAEVARLQTADIYVNIQGDEPMISPEAISLAVGLLLEDPQLQVTNLATKIRCQTDLNDATVPKVVVNDEMFAIFLSRLPIPYPKDPNAVGYYLKQVCVYGFRRPALLRFGELPMGRIEACEGIELLRFIENGIPVKILISDEDTVAVDTPEDLDRVRLLLKEELS